MVNTPHFDFPFSFGANGHAAVVDQGSQQDVENCVEAIVSTPRGTRLFVPKFGIDDPTFTNQPINLDLIRQQVRDTEPRATLLLSQNPDVLEAIIADVQIGVSGGS